MGALSFLIFLIFSLFFFWSVCVLERIDMQPMRAILRATDCWVWWREIIRRERKKERKKSEWQGEEYLNAGTILQCLSVCLSVCLLNLSVHLSSTSILMSVHCLTLSNYILHLPFYLNEVDAEITLQSTYLNNFPFVYLSISYVFLYLEVFIFCSVSLLS